MQARALRPGSRIGLISPASPIRRESTDFAIQWLADQGYEAGLFPHALESDAYLAGSDAHRAADFNAAFADPEIDAVYCTRGGYGCARIMPLLDLDAAANSGKLFIGFSDITTLHLALNQRGLPTLYGPMPLTLSRPREPWVYQSLADQMQGGAAVPSTAPTGVTLNPGIAEGITTGGCLCLLTDSIGTPDGLDPTGKILFIEDVDENPHRVDAMFTHLLNSGLAQRSAGIVIGEMTGTDARVDEGIGGRPWREIVRDRLGDLGIPTIIDYPFGHAPQMLTIPLGVPARLNADLGTVEFLEAVCA